ncbi:MAG TPA: 2-amino-4-hydroxy-6-hydroxymethyldihydropteridine diphosphokinase [Thermoanaerobaculia bacterium]
MRRPPRNPRRRPISTTTSSRKARSRRKKTTRKKKSTKPGRGAREKRDKRDEESRPGIAYLALGSNRGDRRDYLERAVDALSRLAPLLGASSIYRTDPVGYRRQRPFYNAVVAIRWKGSAVRLLRATQAIERELGRTGSFANGPREIDIDILDVNGTRRRASDPILPHPRLRGRRFVLAPLAELAPEWTDPETGATARELLRALPPRPGARRLSGPSRTSSSPRGWPARRPGS